MLEMIPLEQMLIQNIWVALIIWVAAYTSDYYLTIYTAGLYRTTLKEHVVLGGSFELTPAFQRDVDLLRRFSPRFVVALILSSVMLLVIWALTTIVIDFPPVFAVAIGGVLLRELAILTRHIRNLIFFRAARTPGSLSGRVEYARWVTLRISATELLTFAGLFVLIFLATGSWLLLGGAVSTFLSGVQHWTLSTKSYQGAQRSSQ